MNVFVNIGLPTAPHGVRGWVKVVPLTDDPNRFSLVKTVYIEKAVGERRALEIEGIKFQAERVLLKFKGIDTPEQAAELKGRKLQIPESEVPKIVEKDTYYAYQIEGMLVIDEDGETLGTLEAIYSTGSNDVYLVRSPDGKTEYMIPALKRCIRNVDVGRRIMVVDREWAV